MCVAFLTPERNFVAKTQDLVTQLVLRVKGGGEGGQRPGTTGVECVYGKGEGGRRSGRRKSDRVQGPPRREQGNLGLWDKDVTCGVIEKVHV